MSVYDKQQAQLRKIKQAGIQLTGQPLKATFTGSKQSIAEQKAAYYRHLKFVHRIQTVPKEMKR